MHIRVSQSRGMQVVDDGVQQVVGFLDDPLVDPDTGRIAGFFVVPAFFGAEELFLQSVDIVSWGTRVHILEEDRLGPPEEFVRLQERFTDTRSFLGQTIRTKGTNRTLGILADLQFNTRHFTVEWLFPRRFFILRSPIPVTDVLEVTPEAVWVRDPLRPVRESTKTSVESSSLLTDVLPQTQIRIASGDRI